VKRCDDPVGGGLHTRAAAVTSSKHRISSADFEDFQEVQRGVRESIIDLLRLRDELEADRSVEVTNNWTLSTTQRPVKLILRLVSIKELLRFEFPADFLQDDFFFETIA
jgi:hypothetical protein